MRFDDKNFIPERFKPEDVGKFRAGMGHLMRTRRNMDLYDGGIAVSDKEAQECLTFVQGVAKQVVQYLLEGI